MNGLSRMARGCRRPTLSVTLSAKTGNLKDLEAKELDVELIGKVEAASP